MSSLKYHHSKCKLFNNQQRNNNNNNYDNNNNNNDVLYINDKPIWPLPVFDILNLVPATSGTYSKYWKIVGNITNDNITINTLRYIGGTYNEHFAISGGKHRFRIVTNIAPPFVQLSTKLDNYTCLSGELCLEVQQLYLNCS